ncbi:LLM class flavin-dependent oxidoreductase [Streptomyces sp. RerS4]|uniref:LLM class flavin-dependent oxidoreductase n=1 Tax=Streptomyces sp. RerS4 TaxID=2942449 RepID=UPI00201C9C02|nr:LLM class flavin-dependent oxidoreductase [Streptomyces sp. RerS4]UQX01771.1 LLM class flavin-dependent oxidoreductase [Streptomyces sp. RerS4]
MSRSVSVLLPIVPTRAEHAAPFAAFVQWRGARALWQGQQLLNEQHQVFAQLSGMGLRVPFGICVSLMPSRHPVQAAIEARTLAAASGHPVTAGFGPGARAFQEGVLGEPYKSPLTACREYLDIVRGVLDGDDVDQRGTYFSYTGSIPRSPAPPVEVGLGVLRPGMARIAGQTADVAITWLTPPTYVRDVIVPALREGAEAAGRPVPRVVSVVPMAAAADGRDTLAALGAGSCDHFAAPHYQDMLTRAGVRVDGEDPTATTKSLLAAGGALIGDPAELAAGIAAYHAAGTDEVVLNNVGVATLEGPRAVLRDLEALFNGNGW